ncbi:MAG TPA: cache domain-containing protein, partial [Gemmatimonadaceae bacterium]
MTIVTLAIFVIGIWSLAFYSSRKLHNDLRRLLSDQQFSVVTLVAEEVNQELSDRLVVLERVAKRVSPALLGDAVALQAFLEERLILQGPFNSEVVVYRHDGTAVGRVPRSKGLVNFRPADGDPVAAALTAGKTTVGRPVVDTALRAGVFGMAVPIRDPQGVVIGALVGVTNLAQSNFLDRITGHRYGKTGHYFIVAPRERLLVMSSNRSRIMEKLPGPGVIAWLDRAFEGYEGSAVYQNQFGEEMLASDKRV